MTVTYGGGIFILAAYQDLYVSVNGYDWKKLDSKPEGYRGSYATNCMTYSKKLKKFVAGRGRGKICSADWSPPASITWNGKTSTITDETALDEISVSAGQTVTFTSKNVALISATVSGLQEQIIGGRVTMPDPGKVTIKATPQNPKAKPAGVVDGVDEIDLDSFDLEWKDVSNFYDASNPKTKIENYTLNFRFITTAEDNKIWAGSNSSGYLAYSTDGLAWYLMNGTQRGDAHSGSFWDLSYNSEKGYIATCYSNYVLYSEDGKIGTWTKISLPSGSYSDCVSYGNGKYVIGMNSGYTNYLETGSTSWIATNRLGTNSWSDVIYDNDAVDDPIEEREAIAVDGVDDPVGIHRRDVGAVDNRFADRIRGVFGDIGVERNDQPQLGDPARSDRQAFARGLDAVRGGDRIDGDEVPPDHVDGVDGDLGNDPVDGERILGTDGDIDSGRSVCGDGADVVGVADDVRDNVRSEGLNFFEGQNIEGVPKSGALRVDV